MDYRKFGECYYIRMDRDDEIISTILEICKNHNPNSTATNDCGFLRSKFYICAIA